MENCRQELDDIIRERRIRSVFQPIVSLRDGNIFGFEALSRITGHSADREMSSTRWRKA